MGQIAAGLDQYLAHLEVALPGSIEERRLLGYLIDVVGID
jgi:hypothetical protein